MRDLNDVLPSPVLFWRNRLFKPDSRCRRFLIETAARKDRSFMGPFLPDCSRWDTIVTGVRWNVGLLLQVRPSFCTFVLAIRLRVVIHDKLDLWDRSVNTCKMFTRLLLQHLQMVHAMSNTMTSPFLYHMRASSLSLLNFLLDQPRSAPYTIPWF